MPLLRSTRAEVYLKATFTRLVTVPSLGTCSFYIGSAALPTEPLYPVGTAAFGPALLIRLVNQLISQLPYISIGDSTIRRLWTHQLAVELCNWLTL